jgi:Ca2+-binding EF-hand superfamily protein
MIWAMILAIALAVHPVLAAKKKKPKRNPAARFAAMDVNKDGQISSEEFLARKKPEQKEAAAKRFAKFDTDKNGLLSREEFAAALAARKNKNR